MTPEEWGAIGVVASAIVTAGATVAVGRRAQRGDEKSQELAANAGIASGYSLLTSDLRRDIEQLRKDRDADRRSHREQRIQDLSRMDEIEERLDQAMRRYKAALAYIRLLLAFVADKVPGHEAPSPPDDLMLDLN